MQQRAVGTLSRIMGITLVLFFHADLWSQSHDIHIGVGSLQITLNSGFASRSRRLQFPREYAVYKTSENDQDQVAAKGGGIIIGVRNFQAKAYYPLGLPESNKPNNNWVVADSLFPVYVVDATSNFNYDLVHTTVPVQEALKRYWKYAPPTRIVDGEDLSSSEWDPNYEAVDSDLITEQMGVAQCRTALGLTVTERAYIFGHPGYDDFAIVEYIFKNTGETGSSYADGSPIVYPDNVLTDCYVGVKLWPTIYENTVVPNSGGWKEGTDDWIDYVYIEDGDTVRTMFGWDGDAGDSYQAMDDEGDPLVFSSGIFLATQYPGMGVLHVDTAPGHPVNDMSQPHLSYVSYGGITSDNTLSLGKMSMEEIYDILETGGTLTSPLDWGQWRDYGVEDWLRATRYPTEQYNQIGTLVFGPYQFEQIGDSVRVVLCFSVGTIGWEEAIDLGAWWKDRYQNPTEAETLEKNRTLRSGRDSLLVKIQEVKDLFKQPGGGYDFHIETIASRISSPPAWPDFIELSSEVGGCGVAWGAVPGATAYRVYRRLQPEFHVEVPVTETYTLVYQCGGLNPGGDVEYVEDVVTEWLDTHTVPTQPYWYAVTALDADGVESSRFVTRTDPAPDQGRPLWGSVSPFAQPPVTLDSVYVVPNPYHVKAASMLYGRPENVLNFVGLPASCRIRIFTQSGDLVTTIEHEYEFPPTSGETWEMRTSMNQTIASGLYYFVVDDCRDHDNEPIPVSKVGKFVVIR